MDGRGKRGGRCVHVAEERIREEIPTESLKFASIFGNFPVPYFVGKTLTSEATIVVNQPEQFIKKLSLITGMRASIMWKCNISTSFPAGWNADMNMTWQHWSEKKVTSSRHRTNYCPASLHVSTCINAVLKQDIISGLGELVRRISAVPVSYLRCTESNDWRRFMTAFPYSMTTLWRKVEYRERQWQWWRGTGSLAIVPPPGGLAYGRWQ